MPIRRDSKGRFTGVGRRRVGRQARKLHAVSTATRAGHRGKKLTGGVTKRLMVRGGSGMRRSVGIRAGRGRRSIVRMPGGGTVNLPRFR